ncbi:helicase loader DnaI [Sporolactobacillus inulinus]|uniref:Helicase loader DnaI n=1 Tax=Sporolactobacillus inulinus TaxID=2078 RepID=A0A4Y1Z7M0_9BACL|nr:helicase loader DnaI [Sporolactobacillus inulinus]
MDPLASLFKELSAGRNVQKQWRQLENELSTHPDVRKLQKKIRILTKRLGQETHHGCFSSSLNERLVRIVQDSTTVRT